MMKIEKILLSVVLSFAGMIVVCGAPAMATSAVDGNTVSAIGSSPEQPSQPAPAIAQPVPQTVPAPSTAAAPPAPLTSQSTKITPVVTPAPNPAPPPAQPLANPVPPAAVSQPAESGSLSGTNVMGDSGAAQKHSGTYYDSTAIVPDSDMMSSGAAGPRKVDPALEPGQTFVVVDKTGSATSFEAQYTAATRALKLGRYAAAMEMFEKLYKKNHRDPRILMGLAVAQQGAGFRESAAQTYEDLLRVQPNNADALVNLMGIMSAQYPSVTLKKLGDLRNKFPTNPGIPAQMGLVSAELRNYDEAIQYFEIAASLEPNNPSHAYNMAIIADRAGRSAQAIKLYEQALQLDATYGSSATSLPREQIYDRLVVLRRKV